MSSTQETGRLRRADHSHYHQLPVEVQEIELPNTPDDHRYGVNVRVWSFSNPPSTFPGREIPIIYKIINRQPEKTEIDVYYLDGFGHMLSHVGSVEVEGQETKPEDTKVDRDFSKLRGYRDTIAGSPALNTSALLRLEEILA